MAAYCRWYEKDMVELTEWQQEQCEENGLTCFDCEDLVKDRAEESEWEK